VSTDTWRDEMGCLCKTQDDEAASQHLGRPGEEASRARHCVFQVEGQGMEVNALRRPRLPV
jgi:hypothetical protein